jgi:metal-dependent amidase/aminoacylase/carboxypeptidase family protein
MVLYTALAFASRNQLFPYILRFIFQPAEEVGAGHFK